MITVLLIIGAFVAGVTVTKALRGKNPLVDDSGWISGPSTLGVIVLVITLPIWGPIAWVTSKVKRRV